MAAGDNEVSAEGQTVTYDGTGHGLKRAEALKEGSTLWYSTDNKEFSETAPSFTDAGSYTVYVKATNPNYKETPVVNATIVINKKEAVIIVDNVTKVYGYEDPLFTGSISELIGSDDLGTVAFVRQSGDERKNNVGDKVRLTANYTENSNYHVVVYEGHLTIVAATDNGVNVEGQALVYDGLNHGLKNAIALKEGSKLLYSTNKIEFSETAPTFTEAGTYTVYVKATNPNYNETQVAEGTVVISKREITITADSAEKRYDGTDLTAPTATITGGTLAEGQTLESVTVTGAQRSTGTSANVASNAMIKSGNTDVTANYAITYTDGVLTVTSVGGNSGGNPGGNGGGSTPNENKPYQPGGPGDNNGPTVTIDPDAVPLANAPVDGSPTDNLILIDDGNVPLAGLPKTGDRAGAQAGLAAILSGFLLAAFSMLNNKKKEENK